MTEIAIRRESAGGPRDSFLVAYRDHLLRELAEVQRRLGASRPGPAAEDIARSVGLDS